MNGLREACNSAGESTFEVAPVHVFSVAPQPSASGPVRRAQSSGQANVRSTLNSALRRLLTDRSDVIVLGEDLHDPYGGAFKVTAGLSTDFPERVISTPISEAGVVGAAIGLALAGYHPIAEIMFADFLTLAMDQIYNHAVKFPGMMRRVPRSSVSATQTSVVSELPGAVQSILRRGRLGCINAA